MKLLGGNDMGDFMKRVFLLMTLVLVSFFVFRPPVAIGTKPPEIERLEPVDWYGYWVNKIPNWDNPKNVHGEKLNEIRWYLRINPQIESIVPGRSSNPPNVKRVERLIPQTQFEAMFPNTKLMVKNTHKIIPGEIYNYTNFLKAVGSMPAYCSDYGMDREDEKFPNLSRSTTQMEDENTLCKRMLAMTFAHATQEVSDGTIGNMLDKIKNTFAQVDENDGVMPALLDANGPFSLTGKFAEMVRNNKYFGRGIKQVTYPSNYANTSLLLYGDLRLVEHPELMSKGFLPYLSAIAYALTPKDSRPSIAEVMDGTFGRRIDGTSIEAYDRGFSTTISLVNGGPECMGKNHVQTKNRIDAYEYFSRNGKLFAVGFDPSKHGELRGCEGIDHDNAAYYTANRRYYMISTVTCTLEKWAGGIPIFGGEPAFEIFCP